MAGTWGNNLKITIYGESHGRSVGIIVDGLPSGIRINEDFVISQMKRRAPGQNPWSTPRKESDMPLIQSGVYNGYTTGTPLAAIIPNENQHSDAYNHLSGKARPGHADYSAFIRYSGFNDPRGGGHFSGRITAGLVFAGAVAELLLEYADVVCGGWITGIGSIKTDKYPLKISTDMLNNLKKNDFPLIDECNTDLMKNEIQSARTNMDSIGGSIAVCALNVPPGWGDPFFNSIESVASGLFFSIPAVKGVEFGSGFEMSEMLGSQANDCWHIDNGTAYTSTNHNGGINGGITNGMPILAHLGIKPTPSIAKAQTTIDFIENKEIELSTKGRHDPCIVPRAVVVAESALALTLADFAVGYYGRKRVEKWKN